MLWSPSSLVVTLLCSPPCRSLPHPLHADGCFWGGAPLLHGAGPGAVPQDRCHPHLEAHLPHL